MEMKTPQCRVDWPGTFPGTRTGCFGVSEGTIDGVPACGAHIKSARDEHTSQLTYLDDDETWHHARRKSLSAKVVTYVERIAELEAEVERLRYACRGGTALRDTADLLVFIADRMVSEHGEDGATDWVRASYERARMLREALTNHTKRPKGICNDTQERIEELEADVERLRNTTTSSASTLYMLVASLEAEGARSVSTEDLRRIARELE